MRKSNQDDAANLDGAIQACLRCKEVGGLGLKKPASMDRGNPNAEVMVVGMAPGTSAMARRLALAGNSFSRLLSLFRDGGYGGDEAGLRAQLYITSLIKCVPVPDGVAIKRYYHYCRHFLWKQIEIVGPRVVILLGREAMSLVLGLKAPVDRVAGDVYTSEELVRGRLLPDLPMQVRWLVLPHPSGMSRTLNDESVRARSVAGIVEAVLRPGLVRSYYD